ncbi:7-deoxyloganetic acid glucosyltransferase [Glycine max]|nr:7-deoxyloganetic acid glucosyltransferase [Glycine max]
MEHSDTPHILAIPFPAEGHIKPMFNLAKLLSHRGHRITFMNTHHNHNRLLQFTDLPSFHTQFPDFLFASITDGIPSDNPRKGALLNYLPMLITPSARSLVAKEFRELFSRLLEKNGDRWQQPSCIIVDGLMSTIVMGVAQEFRIPVIAFRTYSPTCTWVTIFMSKLAQEGAQLLRSNQGLENLLRNCDFPYPGGMRDLIVEETLAMTQASAIILNTFEQLEPSIITKLATIFPKVYSIGPIHTLCKTMITTNSNSSPHKDGRLRKETYQGNPCGVYPDLSSFTGSGVIQTSVACIKRSTPTQTYQGNPCGVYPDLSSFTGSGVIQTSVPCIKRSTPTQVHIIHSYSGSHQEDRSCITWLDHQKAKSVLYVSFGTVVKLSHEQLMEFWHGLVNSLKPFLLVLQKDLIIQKNVPIELEIGTKEREVLAHPAVGGFLTHCGWNSTLESIAEGVPMLCWPSIADQTVNSRCVSEQWKIGLNMNGSCDRFFVEKMVRDIMENEDLMRLANDVAKKALHG